MKIVALDSSSSVGSVALLDGAQVVAEEELPPMAHSELLVPTLARLMEQHGWRPNELALVACGAGPGSFTGLRIGLATAKGLCFATGAALQLVSSLAAMAAGAAARVADAEGVGLGSTRLCANDDPSTILWVPTLESRKDELFAGFYRVVAGGLPIAVTPEVAVSPLALHTAVERAFQEGGTELGSTPKAYLFGQGAARYRDLLASHADPRMSRAIDELPLRPAASTIGRLAQLSPRAEDRSDLANSVPSYVSTPDISIPRPPARPPGRQTDPGRR